MSSMHGAQLRLSLFGESHGNAIGVVLDGLAPGMVVDESRIAARLALRAPRGDISTPRREPDQVEILSGVFQGRTTGTPLCLIIRNSDRRSRDYTELQHLPRPSHADYSGHVKYQGFGDYRGGGHFSGRITAPLVAAGAILKDALAAKGIHVAAHIARMAGIQDDPIPMDGGLLPALDTLNGRWFPTLNEGAGQRMQQAIREASAARDSLGGELEIVAAGMPAGVGGPFFHSVESELSARLFSVPGIKGVSFGLGFGFAEVPGSVANDPFYWQEGVKTRTNHNGGINGGITNGMPIVIRCAVRPTASIAREQETIDLRDHSSRRLSIEGRHDPAIIHRVRAVVDTMVVFGLADLCARRFGYLWLGEG